MDRSRESSCRSSVVSTPGLPAFGDAERSIGGASQVAIALLVTARLEKLAERVLPVLRQRSATPAPGDVFVPVRDPDLIV